MSEYGFVEIQIYTHPSASFWISTSISIGICASVYILPLYVYIGMYTLPEVFKRECLNPQI